MLKKIFKGIAIFFVVVLVLMISLPFIFKGKIEQAVKQAINDQVNAKVMYGDVGISMFRSFPKLSLSIKDIAVIGIKEFDQDTLANIAELDVAVDIMSIIKSGQTMQVHAIHLDHPKINALVLADGKANWDIMKPSKETDTKSEPLKLALQKMSISDAQIAYSDLQQNLFAVLNHMDFEGKGDFAQDIFTLSTNTQIKELSVVSDGISYLKKSKFDLQADIKVDQIQDKYSFTKNTLQLNDLKIEFDGFVKMMNDAIDMDLKFAAAQTDFKNLLSLVPSIYAKDFDKIKSSGKIELSGMLKGKYTDKAYPSFNLHAKIDQAMFQYPDLPSKVSDINALIDIENKTGGSLDNTVINIPKLHFSIDQEPVDMVLKISTPMSDPNIDGRLKGKINLKKVPSFYPIDGLKKLEGLLAIDVQAKARMSQIQREDYSHVFAAGTASISNMKYEGKDLDWPVSISSVNFKFNPKTVDMTGFNAQIGASDFHASGSLSNYLPYIFSNDLLKGNLTLTSAKIDLDEMMGVSDSKASSSTSPDEGGIEIPANIDFDFTSQINKLVFKGLDLSNVKGHLLVKDQAVDLSGLYTELLGGTMNLSGKYDAKDQSEPKINFNYKIQNIDFQKSFKAIPSMEKLAPIAKYLNGLFSTDMQLTTSLNKDLSPNYNTLTGVAKVKIDYAKLVNLPVIQQIASITKLPILNPLEVKNAWTELKFTNGRIFIEKPYTIKVQDYSLTISGSNGFDHSMDYQLAIDVPSDKLGTAKTMAQNFLAKAPIPGLNGLLPEILTFHLKIGGTIEKPQVSLSKISAGGQGKSIGQQATETLKDQAQKTADDLKNKAETEAQKQIDLAKAEAQKKIDQAKADAAKQAADQINKAKDQIKKNIKLPW